MNNWASLTQAAEHAAHDVNRAWAALGVARNDRDVIVALARTVKALSAQLKLADQAVGYLMDQRERTKIPCKN
jgi:hypothetical protein